MLPSREDVKLFVKAFLVSIALIGAGCAVQQRWYRGPGENKPKSIHLAPSVSIKMESLDRLEIYVGGVHAGTFVFDGSGAVFVGDSAPAARVIQELLTQIEMLRAYQDESNEETYH
jgi:hypothetical protein